MAQEWIYDADCKGHAKEHRGAAHIKGEGSCQEFLILKHQEEDYEKEQA